MAPKPRFDRAIGPALGICQIALGGTNYLLHSAECGCGNCFLASVFVPLEIGLLCLLLGLGAATLPRSP